MATANAQAIIYTVNSTADGSNTGPNTACDDGTGQCTLRAAMEAANAHPAQDIITFNLPAGSVINLTRALPVITEGVIITGNAANPVTVRRDTGGDYRIFEIAVAHVVRISGLTISNGRLAGSGAGLLASAPSFVTVTDCTFSGNSALDDPMGPLYRGGAVANTSSGQLILIRCTITGNSAPIGGGAANSGGGELSLAGCTFSANTADFSGGGIYNSNQMSSSVFVFDSTFVGNSALSGGAALNNTGNLRIDNSTFAGNSATGTSAGSGGGAIFAGSGFVTISHSTFANNSAAGQGGGVFTVNASTGMLSNIVATNTATSAGPDVRLSGSGTLGSGGFNLIGRNDGAEMSFPAGNPNPNKDIVGTAVSPVDPGLDPSGLQDNGGSTATIALLFTSPAVDKGTSLQAGLEGNLSTDQRGEGFPRTFDYPAVANAASGDGTDIGAFELLAPFSVSRKTHAGTPFDLDLTLPGGVRVESRSAGPSGEHQVIVNFAVPVTVANASVTGGVGTVSSFSVSGSQVTVNLTAVADAQMLAFTLSGVNDGTGARDYTIPMGVLLGDSNNNGAVNSGDVIQTRNRSGESTGPTNFRSDVNLDGTINSGDATVVRSRSGRFIP